MLTAFKSDTKLFVNTTFIKLRYQQLDLFNSDALTSAHNVHVFQQYYMYTTPSPVCPCDNIGLVSLILLGWELRVSYITVLCVQGNLILSPLLFMPSLYSTFKIEVFLIYLKTKIHIKLFSQSLRALIHSTEKEGEHLKKHRKHPKYAYVC